MGRSAACGLRLEDRHVSGEHATVAWSGRSWEIRDLGSRNGTYVNGLKIDVGESLRITKGTRVAFGDPQESWEMIDDDPPSIMAEHTETATIRSGQGDLLTLPDDDQPEVSVYGDATGWWLDTGDGRPTAVGDGDVVRTSSGGWKIYLPAAFEGTPLMQLRMSLENVQLQFGVSRNEEKVQINLVARGAEIPLTPREHGYVLLTLARARLEDTALNVEERGWRDRRDLERMLALDSNALNVAIHRARQQLASAGVQGAAQIVEVKRRQRRLGTDRFRIRTIEEDE
ncbi:MAG: FHA domain-containing protein [Myxococcota bacterium]